MTLPCKPGCGTVLVDGEKPYSCSDLFGHDYDTCWCSSVGCADDQTRAFCSEACREAGRPLNPRLTHEEVLEIAARVRECYQAAVRETAEMARELDERSERNRK